MTVPPGDKGLKPEPGKAVGLFLCGDVMLGRGVDQILAHPGDPALHEAFVRSALDYVRLAEDANGRIPRAVAPDYVWGDALTELSGAQPQARIINLETSITKSAAYFPKGINYRMNPENIGVVSTALIDCCVLANNHVLDFGRDGLIETLETLHRAGLRTAGAGHDAAEAARPAIIDLPDGGRVLVFAFGHASSGIPPDWAAAPGVPGINFLPDFSDYTIAAITDRTRSMRHDGDLLVASIHWGGNWGYPIPTQHRRFAHRLIDTAGFDVVHGHSSHHPKTIEAYGERLILYGCGDFLNDYEGIGGYEGYRSDLRLMYLPQLGAATGKLLSLRLVPFKIARFQLHRATIAEARWLQQTLNEHCQTCKMSFALDADGRLWGHWS